MPQRWTHRCKTPWFDVLPFATEAAPRGDHLKFVDPDLVSLDDVDAASSVAVTAMQALFAYAQRGHAQAVGGYAVQLTRQVR